MKKCYTASCKQLGARISPLKGFLSRVDHHVISERVLLPQHLAADVAGMFLLQEYLVLVGHVAVLCGLPSVPGTDGTQPLFMGDLLELCNHIVELDEFWEIIVHSRHTVETGYKKAACNNKSSTRVYRRGHSYKRSSYLRQFSFGRKGFLYPVYTVFSIYFVSFTSIADRKSQIRQGLSFCTADL